MTSETKEEKKKTKTRVRRTNEKTSDLKVKQGTPIKEDIRSRALCAADGPCETKNENHILDLVK